MVALSDETAALSDETTALLDETVAMLDKMVVLLDKTVVMLDETAVLSDKTVAMLDKMVVLSDKTVAMLDKTVVLSDPCLSSPTEMVAVLDPCPLSPTVMGAVLDPHPLLPREFGPAVANERGGARVGGGGRMPIITYKKRGEVWRMPIGRAEGGGLTLFVFMALIAYQNMRGGCGGGFLGGTAAPRGVLGWEQWDGGSCSVSAFLGSDHDAAGLEGYLSPVMSLAWVLIWPGVM
ncbi:hypothetical protein L208DRAFT_1376517 [Tricholoma matsutake]|nr:hypothetical protein L208DRAFT_1376517 [Tricholoma matsutake 945]